MDEAIRIGCSGWAYKDWKGPFYPAELKDAAGLPRLMQALADRGYGDAELTKIAHGNWVRVLRATWGE